MIPSNSKLLSEDINTESYGSDTYKMHIEDLNIAGIAKDLESVKQMCYKILNTERFEYLAYSWEFGLRVVDLYGKQYDYVVAELERRITEALTQDDRIESVDNFEFSKDKNKVLCKFSVHTIFGGFDEEKVVAI